MNKVFKMSSDELVSESNRYLINNYGRVPFAVALGSGSYLYDPEGQEYLDLFCGFGAGGIGGHCHPAITEKIQQQLVALTVHGNLFHSEPQLQLAQKLIKHSFPGKLFFCHSGAEANEAAIKLIRRRSNGTRHKIISFHNCFHGRTLGGLSITPPSFQEGFGPMLPGSIFLPWGDLDLLKKSIDPETAGIFIEPLQGEGGINLPTTDFLRGLVNLCREHDLTLVCDEVWTAPARTGRWFGYQHFDFVPDIVTLGKALGGGLPLAGMIVSEHLTEILSPGTHGCTMGGNPLCAAAGLAALELIEDQGLVRRAFELEKIAQNVFSATELKIRGKGVMLGIALPDQVNVQEIVKVCRESKILVGAAKNNVLRFAPALTIPAEIWMEGLERILEIIDKKLD